jgi:hypothetical protein
MDVEPAAHETRGNVGLEIGEDQDDIGFQCEDFVDIRRGERAHSGLL